MRTVIVRPEFLDVGLAVITEYEEQQENDQTWFYVYSYWEGWMGFAEDLVVRSDKQYITGKLEGMHQSLKLEFSTKEAAEEILEVLHKSQVEVFTKLKKELSLLVVAKLAESI